MTTVNRYIVFLFLEKQINFNYTHDTIKMHIFLHTSIIAGERSGPESVQRLYWVLIKLSVELNLLIQPYLLALSSASQSQSAVQPD